MDGIWFNTYITTLHTTPYMSADILRCIDRFADVMILRSGEDVAMVGADDGSQFWNYPFAALEAERVSYFDQEVFMSPEEVEAVLVSGIDLERIWPFCHKDVELDKRIKDIYEARIKESNTQMSEFRQGSMRDGMGNTEYQDKDTILREKHAVIRKVMLDYLKFDTSSYLDVTKQVTIKKALHLLWTLENDKRKAAQFFPLRNEGNHKELLFLLLLFEYVCPVSLRGSAPNKYLLIATSIRKDSAVEMDENMVYTSYSDIQHCVSEVLPILKEHADTIAEIKYGNELYRDDHRVKPPGSH